MFSLRWTFVLVEFSSLRFSTSVCNLKKVSGSSHRWMERQLKDPYVERAKMENYRARSAYKLLEIDSRFRLLHPGQFVLECGAAPGAWTQVITKKVIQNASPKDPPGLVISLDLLPFFPVPGATILTPCDVTNPNTHDRIRAHLPNGQKLNLVLSDIAPNATGIAELDNEKLGDIAYHVLRLALVLGDVGSHLLVKFWDGSSLVKFRNDVGRFYESVKEVKPKSSRADSSEKYILARGFKGVDIVSEGK